MQWRERDQTRDEESNTAWWPPLATTPSLAKPPSFTFFPSSFSRANQRQLREKEWGFGNKASTERNDEDVATREDDSWWRIYLALGKENENNFVLDYFFLLFFLHASGMTERVTIILIRKFVG